ncbi:MAG TPA: GGDEF domain-containing protein [Bellilinea sp.]|nr:GGDEF domain-containing protein [Bellilinea sp.]
MFETGEPKATGLIVDPNWGTFVTGLALIKDKQTGESLGLVGVDFSAADVSKMLQTLRSALYYVNIIVALASLLIIHWLVDLQEKALNTDFLTQLESKRSFESAAAEMINESKRLGVPSTMIMMDINYFKNINDVHGHVEGDKVLREIAELIDSSTRKGDLRFRLGGDEFAMLLPHTHLVQANAVKARIYENTEHYFAGMSERDNTDYSMSQGVVQWRDDWTMEEWVAAADAAMYAEKNQLKLNI